MAKVGIYCDGFNIYYGLRNYYFSTRKCLYWLNIASFCHALAVRQPYSAKGDVASVIKYFTADPVDIQQRARHQYYFSAIRSLGGVDIIDGRYATKAKACHAVCKTCNAPCQHSPLTHEEKETDVSIGLHILNDAYKRLYDRLVLVSADSDFVPVVRLLRAEFPCIHTVVLAPFSNDRGVRLGGQAQYHTQLKLADYAPHMLPPEVTARCGTTFACPDTWR